MHAAPSVWADYRPMMIERVDALALATDADAGPDALAVAREAAHKLAGTLGSFGFPRGSELAHEAEILLRDGRTGGLEELIVALRDELAPEAPAFVATTIAVVPSLPHLVVITDDSAGASHVADEAARRGLRTTAIR